MDAVVGEYILSATNRTEFAKRFGDDGARLDALYKSALAEGASPADIDYMQNVVRSAVGIYGMDGSPLLRMVSPTLASRLAKQDAKAITDGIMAYQNWRNLPLATLSSLMETFGPMVRTGGDLKIAWESMKTSIRSLANGSTRQEMVDLLQRMEYSTDFAIGENMQSMFGGSQTPLTRKANDLLFKFNGLTRWTTSTRYGALQGAQLFLIKHADGKGKNSLRYLQELNLEPGDVRLIGDSKGMKHVHLLSEAERRKASKDELARDDRVKRALIQFVDEAIPRPNVAQTPLYYSDPLMGPVIQYKSVLYAVYQQYYKRIIREATYGNFGAVMPALFMAVTAAIAELLREGIQWGADGNPQRADWGILDYMWLGAERTALFTPAVSMGKDLLQDYERRYANDIFVGSSMLGPTIKQAMHITSAAAGTRDAAQTFEDALPLSSAWKRWINPTQVTKEPQT